MARTIEQITRGNGRKYVVTDGDERIELPSVTTVLGALPKGGLDWYGFKLGIAAVREVTGIAYDIDQMYERAKQTQFAPHRALKAAGSRGTDVHNVAEVLLREGKLDNLPKGTHADEGFVDALVRWHDREGVADWEMLAVEETLYSLRHLYAGTVDFIAKRPDGVYVVGDFKSSKAVYESHMIQAAAYAFAANELGFIPDGAKVEQHIVRLAPDGEYEVVKSLATIDDFLAVRSVWQSLKDLKSRGKRK